MVQKVIKSNIFFYALVVISAIIVFLGIYGHNIINPTYVELNYMRTGGDVTQHYFGWVGFRNSDWQFPLGLYDNNTYPDSTSIIFTDSIPILAIIFKVFRGILPENFQYFGIFTLACFIAQAVIAARIIKRFCENKIYALLGAILFIVAPILLYRPLIHEALSAQFLILLMIETFLMSKDVKSSTLYIRVGICALLSAGIHIYFLMLCGIVLVGLCLYLLLVKRYKDAIISLADYLAVAALMVYLEGGFSAGITSSGDNGFGQLNINLNTLINPLGKSRFLGEMGIYQWGQGDATCYLGLGCICLVVIAIVLAIVFWKKIKSLITNNKKMSIATLVVLLIAGIFSVIPSITINGHVLLTIKLPTFIENLMSNFRCNGRACWIIVYLLMLLSIIVIYKCIDNRIIVLSIVAGALVIQLIDLSRYFESKYQLANDKYRVETEFDTTPQIQSLLQSDSIKHVVLYTKKLFAEEEDDAITDEYVWAIDNGLTTNYIYLAREDSDKYKKRVEESLNNPSDDTLYVFKIEDENVCQKYGLFYTMSGRYIFARTQPIN